MAMIDQYLFIWTQIFRRTEKLSTICLYLRTRDPDNCDWNANSSVIPDTRYLIRSSLAKKQ